MSPKKGKGLGVGCDCGVSGKFKRGEEFHPEEIHLTQEEKGAKMDMLEIRQSKSQRKMFKCVTSEQIYGGEKALEVCE